ncbi:hypothetical protein L208DRAFT_1238327, partial [Tricholoma matsutake]
YDPTPPPPYPYLCSLLCYSALIQVYSCSGQLPMATHLYSQHKIGSHQCRFGCIRIPEDDHHIFVECPYFTELQSSSLVVIVEFMESRCQDLVEKNLVSHEMVLHLISAAKLLFSDDNTTWLLHHLAFYLGWIPDITILLGFKQPTQHSSLSPSIPLSHNIHFIAMEWHIHSIHLASCIWGQVQCVAAPKLASNVSIFPYLYLDFAHHHVLHPAVVASFPQRGFDATPLVPLFTYSYLL